MRVTVRISNNGKAKEFYFPDAKEVEFLDKCQSFCVWKETIEVLFPIQNVYEVIIQKEEEK